MPKVYILILNYNSWEDTLECLESVLRLTYSNYQVIVIDNHSPNNSWEYIKMWAARNLEVFIDPANPLKHLFYPRLNQLPGYDLFCNKQLYDMKAEDFTRKLTIVQTVSNDGFAAGNNAVIKKIIGEEAFIWLLNPDMVVEPDALSELVSFADTQSTASVIGAVTKDYARPDRVLFYGGGKLNPFAGTGIPIKNIKFIKSIDYISGGSLFTHLDNFSKVGLLPEEYFLYWEETDWCYRASLMGFVFGVCEKAVCYDKIGTSIGRGFLAEYYYSFNALRFYYKFNKKYLPTILFFNVFRILKRLLRQDFARARAIMKASGDFIAHKR